MEASTVVQNETVYIVNRSKNPQVIADLGDKGISWSGYGDDWDHYIRPVSDQQMKYSLGIQLNLQKGVFEIIDLDQVKKELALREARKQGKEDDPEFTMEVEKVVDITPEGLNQELAPSDVATNNADHINAAVAVDPNAKIEDITPQNG